MELITETYFLLKFSKIDSVLYKFQIIQKKKLFKKFEY